MSIARAIAVHYLHAGIPGVVSFMTYRLLGFPKEISVGSASVPDVRLRLGTSDLKVFREIEKGEYAFGLPFSPKVIADAGANIGITSILFATRFPEAKVIAIEAEKSNFDILERNVRAYPSIVPVHAALWNHDGVIVISQPDATTGAAGNWAFVARDEGDGDRVRAVTFATLMKELNIPAFDLVKIDIEGAEQEVFKDVGWLDGVKALMIELHDRYRPGCTAAVEPALAGFDRTRKGYTSLYLRKEVAAAGP